MRKHLLHLLLPLFMLLSQQGAVWHGISHLAGAGHAPSGAAWVHAPEALDGHDDAGHGDAGHVDAGTADTSYADADELSVDRLCDLCLAFDDLAASARAEAPVLALAEAEHVLARNVERASRSLPAPPPRSRDPPLAI